MKNLEPLDISFGVTSTFSTICSLGAIAFIRYQGRLNGTRNISHGKDSHGRTSFIRSNQITAFAAIAFYHLFYMITMYYDMIHQDGQVTIYVGSRMLGLLYLGIYIPFDIFVICCVAWVLLLVRSKVNYDPSFFQFEIVVKIQCYKKSKLSQSYLGQAGKYRISQKADKSLDHQHSCI